MEIYIDDDRLNFELEDEKTVRDVLNSLEGWLGRFERLPVAIAMDGTELNEKNMLTTHATPVDKVGQLRITTASITEVKGENCLELMDYLGRYAAKVKKEDREVVSKEALEGLLWVNKSVRLLAALNGINLQAFPEVDNCLHKALDLVMVQVESLIRIPDIETRYAEFTAHFSPLLEQLIRLVEQFITYAARRMKSEVDLDERLAILAEGFQSLNKRIPSVSSDLQTGNEERAMLTIQETAVMIEDLLSSLNRVALQQMVALESVVLDGVPLSEWMTNIKETGYGIIEAFKNEDSVLLGDLFEYEISEQLKLAVAYINLVRKMMHAG